METSTDKNNTKFYKQRMSVFESVFKLNGKPILPPVMTQKRRIEMLHYKAKALEIERTRPQTIINPVVQKETDTETELEYLKISSINHSRTGARRKIAEQFTLDKLPESPPPLLHLGPRRERSNSECSNKSYIVETPSPLLIKQMREKGINITKCTQSPKKQLRKLSPKHDPKKLRAKSAIQKTGLLKKSSTRSPYAPAYKSPPKTIKNRENNQKSRRILNESVKSQPDLSVDMEQYSEEMKQLLVRKGLAEKKLNEVFEREKCKLIEKMEQTSIRNPVMYISTPLHSEADSEATNHNISSQFSNFDVDNVSVNESLGYDDFFTCGSKTLELSKQKTAPDVNEYHRAATVITAHAKGYLVRRLLKTERVQTIIQTIKDTLIFILDLHSETAHTSNPTDIQLKGMLLQQLIAACDSLRSIFFEISTPDRMAIIAKDRERIRNRLMAKREQQKSSGTRMQDNQPLKSLQLQKCSLFSVNINAESSVSCVQTATQMRSQAQN